MQQALQSMQKHTNWDTEMATKKETKKMTQTTSTKKTAKKTSKTLKTTARNRFLKKLDNITVSRRKDKVQEFPTINAEGKLPSTLKGSDFKVVDINSSSSTHVIVESEKLAQALNAWDSDVCNYGLVLMAQAKKPVFLAAAAFLGAEEYDALNSYAPELAKALKDTVQLRTRMISQLITENQPIAFEMLGEALNMYKGKFMLFKNNNGHQVYGRMMNAQLQRSFYGPYYQVTYSLLTWEEGKLVRKSSSIKIFHTKDSSTFQDWGFQADTGMETLDRYLAQGNKLIQLNKSCGHVHITGNITYKMGWSTREAPATGRCIVDKAGMAMFVPGDSLDDYDDLHGGDAEVNDRNLTEDDIRSMDPYLSVFSFAAKRWGRIHYGQVSDIVFRSNAFEKLVLPTEDKNLVLSLVKNSDATLVSDMIDNKGGGCVLLLHGKPGLGKTLTAEAVAEVLARPLYAVSVGELGVDPEMLEERLQRALQTAQRWNAVLLLDEADIFLESRKSGDVSRNAMVGTFLRLLEYYNGVLILTTNRVADIDSAFYSRISLALKYGEFNTDTRIEVINNLLDTNGITLSDGAVRLLATQNVNGRQIKNAIRLARFMAKDASRDVDANDIFTVLKKLQSFQDTFRPQSVE
jgi:hypothetical protein